MGEKVKRGERGVDIDVDVVGYRYDDGDGLLLIARLRGAALSPSPTSHAGYHKFRQ